MTSQSTIEKVLERKKSRLFAVTALDEDINELDKQRADKVRVRDAAVETLITENVCSAAELKEIGIPRRLGKVTNGRRKGGRRPRAVQQSDPGHDAPYPQQQPAHLQSAASGMFSG